MFSAVVFLNCTRPLHSTVFLFSTQVAGEPLDLRLRPAVQRVRLHHPPRIRIPLGLGPVQAVTTPVGSQRPSASDRAVVVRQSPHRPPSELLSPSSPDLRLLPPLPPPRPPRHLSNRRGPHAMAPRLLPP